LLVDDDDSQRITLSMALRGRGFEVDAVEEWKEAMKKVMKFSYDGIVLDIQLPEVNGLELSKGIKKVMPESKIVLISAFEPPDEIKELDVDIEAFFEKPLDVDELANCLNGFIKETKTAAI